MNATTSSINATPIIAVLYISLFIFVYYFNWLVLLLYYILFEKVSDCE